MTKSTPWPIGSSVIYRRGKYAFPGEVTMRDTDGGVVVKAYGDAQGNYTGMKHIYNDDVLEPYVLGPEFATSAPALVLFPDDNPVTKITGYLKQHADKGHPGIKALGMMMEKLQEIADLEAEHDASPDNEHVLRIEFRCPHTGLKCLPNCTWPSTQCAGFHTPLNEWPD